MDNSKAKSLSRYWLLLGVTALAVAGLFSLVLVIARTPSLADIPLFSSLFHEALVVHVDLSVLVWFLSIACLMWSLLASPSRSFFPFLEEAALISFALGMFAIAASPLDPHGEAMMSNYIPVIMSPVFFLGLALLLCGVILMLIRFFTASSWSLQFNRMLQFLLFSAALIAVIAVMSFFWSYWQMPREIDGQQYYELIFWGGGHVLQFLHTQIMLACWLLLIVVLKPDFQVNCIFCKIALHLGLLGALIAPLIYWSYSVESMQHRNFFTYSMIMVGGLAPMALLMVLLEPLWHVRDERKGSRRALWASLVMSMLLFLYGGILGGMIHGQNVVIPAHYHGSIVGVTLAFMGVAYLFLPQFGYRDVSNWRMAFWQPVIYGGGQLMHISGLAWSGGYGVLRKTPGAINEVSAGVKAAMGLMGLGGMIAIIGGFLFVIVIGKAIVGAPERDA